MSTWVYDEAAGTVSCTFASVIGQNYFLTSNDPDSGSDTISPATSTTTTLTATGVGGLAVGETFDAYVNHGFSLDDRVAVNVFAMGVSSNGVPLAVNWSYNGSHTFTAIFAAPVVGHQYQLRATYNNAGSGQTDSGANVTGSSSTTCTVVVGGSPVATDGISAILWDTTTGFPVGARLFIAGTSSLGAPGTPFPLGGLYVAEGATGATTSYLFSVDPTSGVCSGIGLIPYAITGLAFDPTVDGTLYGVTTANSSSHPKWLVSIDPTTGAATPIANLAVSVSDISFDSTGQLYGMFPASGPTYTHLKKINKVSGAITDVGSVGPIFGGQGSGNAIAIDNQNGDAAWYGASDELYSIDLTTAVITDIGNTGIGGGASQNAQDFDQADTLWVIATVSVGTTGLYTCDTTTAVATLVSTLDTCCMDGMAWYVPVVLPPSGLRAHLPLWRWVVTDLAGATVTILDKLATERFVQPNLNAPLELSGSVASDSPIVNILHTDNLPFLTEGVRQIYGFRREWDDINPVACTLGGHGYYVIRASTLVLQITDEANAGDARSKFSAWDPWQYLFYRPIYIPPLGGGSGPDRLLPQAGHTYPSSMTMDEIVIDILDRMVVNADTADPTSSIKHAFLDWGWSAFYDSTCTGSEIQTCATSANGWHIEPATSVGQALQDICAAGYMDIVLTPIYDPSNRPGILCELSIYKQDSDPDSGAGTRNYTAKFAWDAPGRSTTGFSDLIDGTQRANEVQYRNGTAGALVTLQRDATSIGVYGEYWAEESFPAQTQKIAVEAIAAEQLVLRKTYKQTLTINPAPEFSPEPFVDYYLGDRVPVFLGRAQRGTYQLGDNSPRQPLPPGYQGSVPVPDPATLVWQRIYGIPVDIDDNGVETVRELLVGPIGPPV